MILALQIVVGLVGLAFIVCMFWAFVEWATFIYREDRVAFGVFLVLLVLLGALTCWVWVPRPDRPAIRPVTCEPIGNGDCRTCPFRAVGDRLIFRCDE